VRDGESGESTEKGDVAGELEAERLEKAVLLPSDGLSATAAPRRRVC